METSKVISTDKATVVIQVNPQVAQNAVICDDGQQSRGVYPNTALTGFFKAQPKALGTVQIMIGVVCFLFGIVNTFHSNRYRYIIIISGIPFWGSLIYISAGSLCIAAQNKLNLCVVKASLGMNVISAMTAGIAIVLMCIEIVLSSLDYSRCYSRNYGRGYSHDYSDPEEICLNVKYYLGISGVLLVFSILQFIISICISGFACKATSETDSTVVNVALNQVY
ncbi:membrane-spanning 4-domains subfamily A member 12-like [Pimephales promelas]|uniref:membrane-spanning 4-domains subfamily A member 12-like n=1 Tax=Pimephales promelas TaxID=90988 RepID=UPI001955508E|nr:membrane-spanning 4-domains subfamily A member 12-like [Pimephales promelas]XP_039511691.1 membrane-spanning 4-domains subfamily A member 12-like [Pimephales promelas]KAG1960244.1 membrane-spanning 4-domain, subfamily A, member 17C.1 [Pimephales promelas]